MLLLCRLRRSVELQTTLNSFDGLHPKLMKAGCFTASFSFADVLPADFTRFDEIGANHTLPNAIPDLPPLPVPTSTITVPHSEPPKSPNAADDIEAQLPPSSKLPVTKRTARFGTRGKINLGRGGKSGKASQGIEIGKEADDERTALLKKRRSLNGTEVFYRPYESQGQPSLPLPLV